jgi:hypothetical protein
MNLTKFNQGYLMSSNDGFYGPSLSGAKHPRLNSKRLAGLLLTGLLVAGVVLTTPAASQAASISVGIGISVGIAPPPIPVYTQPPCPSPGFMWTPGYWAYDPVDGYYWVPGTWVAAPQPGFLWTPGYWGWGGSAFMWHAGYWGPHVGFYGGINYGFGYNGIGFFGGEWRGGAFFYNSAVVNIGGGVHITNVYNRTVVNNYVVNRVSYNGGAGGLTARATPAQMEAMHDHHIEAVAAQHQQEMAAHNNRAQFFSENHGRPAVAGTGRPGEFHGGGVVQASRAGGPINPAQFHNNAGRPGGVGGEHGNPAPQRNAEHPQAFSNHGGNPGAHPMNTPAHNNAPAAHNMEANHPAASHPPAEHNTSHPSGGGEHGGGHPEPKGGDQHHR